MDGMRESNKKLMDAVQPGAMEQAANNLEEGTKAKNESDERIHRAHMDELKNIEERRQAANANITARVEALQIELQRKIDESNKISEINRNFAIKFLGTIR